VIVDFRQTNNTEAEPFHHAFPFRLQNLSKTLFIKGESLSRVSHPSLFTKLGLASSQDIFAL
jgi:hypothetical protein